MITIFGISNCDKCRAAKKWFAKQGLDYRLHDLRKDGLTATQLDAWLKEFSPTDLVNKRSTTWRECSAPVRTALIGPQPTAAMLEHPTVLKRPLVTNGTTLLIGYDEDQWHAHFTRNGTQA